MNESPDASLRQCSKCPNSYPATVEFFERYKMSNGMYSLRRVCRSCRRTHSTEWMKHYRQTEKNTEYRKTYRVQRYQEHGEEIRAQSRQWGQKHAEERREYMRQYRQSFPELTHALDRSHKHKRKAQKLAVGGSYTAQDIQDQHRRQKGKCYYCETKLGKTYHADHVVPLNRGGANDISNIVLACPACNMHKHDKLPHEWPEGNRLL